ncbi:MAG: glycosyltransferase family 4 protein [Candidatus Omnitrophica bacterium]|nr:glycosyltransferase family 4 protein [Candidatus Omnitrophota bacterium]
MPKTVTFLTVGDLEETSAVGRYFPIAKELVKRGFNVNCVALHHDYKTLKTKYFTQDNINVFYVGQMSVLKIGNKKYYFGIAKLLSVVFLAIFKMIWKSLSIKTDVYYCFIPQPVNGFASLVCKLIKNKPLLLDCDDYEASSSKLSPFQRFVFRFFENNLPRISERVTHNTYFIKEHFLSLGYDPDKFIYIPDEADLDRLYICDKNKVDDLRKALCLENKKVILYFGSISLNFGHAIDLLIESFPMVKKKIPEAVLLITGRGDAFDEMKALAERIDKDSIIFTGRLPLEDLKYYLRLGHISVDPVRDHISNKARYGIRNAESIALGIPVVTSDIGDRRKMLKDGNLGILVKIDDAYSLAEGITKILKDDDLRDKMSRNCLESLKEHNWGISVDNIIKYTPCLKD